MILELILDLGFLLLYLDLLLTGYYVYSYKKYAPAREYNKMERNPMLVFLFNHFGILIGLCIGSIIIFLIWHILISYITIYISFLMMPLYFRAIINHAKNIRMLNNLIEKKEGINNDE